MEFTKNLPVDSAAFLPCPCNSWFIATRGSFRFFIKLPIPLCIGDGSFLYPFAAGSKITLSATLLKLNIALFKGSKGS